MGPQLLHLRQKNNAAKPKKRAFSESNLTLASLSSSLDRNRCGRVIGSLRFRPAEGPFRNSRSLFAIVALAPTDCVRSKSVGGCVVRKPLCNNFYRSSFRCGPIRRGCDASNNASDVNRTQDNCGPNERGAELRKLACILSHLHSQIQNLPGRRA